MPILGIDTATLVSGVALADTNKLLAEITLQTRKTHSELLMPHIARLLEMAEVKKTDLQGIAVSIGPGSFTGLRIGLATAKALAYALKIPLIGVPTLTALSFACPVPGVLLAPMLDAQKGNVYISLQAWKSEKMVEILPATVLSFDEALAVFKKYDCPILPLGEGAVLHREKLKEQGENVLPAPAHIIMPRAASVAVLGLELLQQGITQDVMTLEPLYIRRSEAEVLWEKRHGACV